MSPMLPITINALKIVQKSLLVSVLLTVTQLATQANAISTNANSPAIDSKTVLSSPKLTAYNYVTVFSPRLLTGLQEFDVNGTPIGLQSNKLIGPKKVGPLFQAIVAVNNDTRYATAFINVKPEPVIVTIPNTETVFSILHLDQYGTSLKGIPKVDGKFQPGVYALTTSSWNGVLPAGMTRVNMPDSETLCILRADKYSSTGVDRDAAAVKFRTDLHMTTLSSYRLKKDAGAFEAVSFIKFVPPVKVFNDLLMNGGPLRTRVYLKLLQTMVNSSSTQPKSAAEKALAKQFDTYFGQLLKPVQQVAIFAGAMDAAIDVRDNYLSNKLPNSQWISFLDFAAWNTTPQGYLNRSSTAMYLQGANDRSVAAYYHVFNDKKGNALNGSNQQTYTLTFPSGQTPPSKRFWSVTAYTPIAIQLVPNVFEKYNVASYTPGLVKNTDGSITIVMSQTKPSNVAMANWLPVPDGQFNLILRAYGTLPAQGSVGGTTDNSYVPPPLVPLK
jgi:hypothetical protein